MNTKLELLKKLQCNPKYIRNVCILAHVDHGKTTLADALIASNGIISNRLAGKLRYMDSREDEQVRGITMKSSAISLHFNRNTEEFLINLIDSPGHVDFGGEVSAAVRLSDAAIIIVDVVEGVCPQTYGALKQAYLENLKPVLVLNKIDRLICELKMTTEEAETRLLQILEQVNAVMGELFTTDVLAKYAQEFESQKNEINDDQLLNYTSLLDDKDDSLIYFSTDHGNIVFASAIHGWGFRIGQFSSIYAKKVGLNEKILNKTLWGDYYLCTKSKSVKKGAKKMAKKSLFVQLILDNIWKMYDVILEKKNKELIEKIVSSLNLALKIHGSDWKGILYNIFKAWLPLSQAMLEMICEKCPSGFGMSEERCNNFIKVKHLTSLPPQTFALKQSLQNCSSSDEAPVIIFISKMFQFDSKHLPKNRPKALTIEEMLAKRERIKNKLSEKNLAINQENNVDNNTSEDIKVDEDKSVFIALGRILSGTIKEGQELFVLGPKHRPQTIIECGEDEYISNSGNVKQFIVSDLYMVMGKELEQLTEVPAGNILGIGGLDKIIFKSATISSTIYAPPFSDVYSTSLPIVTVAVQPRYACDMSKLSEGLKLLNQSDPTVEIIVEDSGEHLVVAAGEIHLQKCLTDLTQIFAKIEINVSAPTVAFRETIIIPPTLDQVNEVIADKFQSHNKQEVSRHGYSKGQLKPETLKLENQCNSESSMIVEHESVDGLVKVLVEALPLPIELYELIEQNKDFIKILLQKNQNTSVKSLNEKLSDDLIKLKAEFCEVLKNLGKPWDEFIDKIWSFGPKKNYSNMLVNNIEDYRRPSLLQEREELHGDKRLVNLTDWDSSILSGFHLAAASGPMCEEAMTRVCFIVHACNVKTEEASKQNWHCIKGLVISTMKECCRQAFQKHPQRLVWPMYSCLIQANVEVLGCVYSVINRRGGSVLSQDMEEGSTMFKVVATIPVVESFGFAEELRKKTSGFALPQLNFSHWQIMSMDPYWVPTTEEELLHFGEKADSSNSAQTYLNNVRRRKGLSVQEHIVQFAEKQRTLTKNK